MEKLVASVMSSFVWNVLRIRLIGCIPNIVGLLVLVCVVVALVFVFMGLVF